MTKKLKVFFFVITAILIFGGVLLFGRTFPKAALHPAPTAEKKIIRKVVSHDRMVRPAIPEHIEKYHDLMLKYALNYESPDWLIRQYEAMPRAFPLRYRIGVLSDDITAGVAYVIEIIEE